MEISTIGLDLAKNVFQVHGIPGPTGAGRQVCQAVTAPVADILKIDYRERMQPQANDRARICLEFNEDGLTVLGNREALMDLRAQLDWLLAGPPEEHWHCHVLLSLENDESRFDGKRPRNAGLIISDGFQLIAEKEDPLGPIVDLTFVHASNQTLDDKQKRQR